MRDELVLALVTDSHDRVGWRERVLEAGVASGAAGPAAEPRSVQTIHRRAPSSEIQPGATTFPLYEDLLTDV